MDKIYEYKKNENIRWIYNATKPWHRNVLLLVIISVTNTICTLRNAVYLRNLIDAATDRNRELLLHTIGVMLVLMLIQVVLQTLSTYWANRTSFSIREGLQFRLFETLIQKDYALVTEKHSGEWMNRIVSDTEGIANALASMIPDVMGILIQVCGAAYLLFRITPGFIPLILSAMAVFGVITLVLREPIKQRQRVLRDTEGNQRVFFTEHLSKLMIVKAFNREEIVTKNGKEHLEDVYRKQMDRMSIVLWKWTAQDAAIRAAYLITVAYGAYEIFQGKITYGTLTMTLRLLTQIRTPILQIGNYITNAFDFIVSAERLREAESYQNDPQISVKSDTEIRDFYENQFTGIHFEDVSFSYYANGNVDPESSTMMLSHIDLSIPKKACVGFTGVTGSGKSTLFKLMMCLYPVSEGKIMLRYGSGSEEELTAAYRRMFAYVPQGNQLMVGSIREVVTFGNKSDFNNDAAIWSALEASCAKDFVENLPNGLDTVIRERGIGLSEGQLQRIAIARALFTQRPILLLDEATNSLDESTEEELLKHLKSMTDRTILIVTHRPNVVSICDCDVHIDGNNVEVRAVPQS